VGAELTAALLDAARTGEDGRWGELSASLAGVDPGSFESDEHRLAFWINLYNALLIHELGAKPRSGHLLRHLRMFRREACTVGGQRYSLDLIEHGVLRRNRRPPAGLRPMLRGGDRRLAVAPARPDPRIHFALNCGARSCPPVIAYEPQRVDAQLAGATRAYLEAETDLDRERGEVRLPALMKVYRADFGDRDEHLAFAARHLPEDAGWITGEGVTVRYGRFDWTIAS
jgi:Protein of unknown function, DUF547